MAEVDTGDHVLHGPTGETWVVARVLEDKLAWCGWPQGWANLADCTLVKKACPESRLRLLREIAGSSGHHCAEWAAGQINGANQMTAQNHALEQARLQYESIEQMPTELDIDYERLAETEDELRSLEGERDEAINILARFAQGLTSHRYTGNCPSDESPSSRDPECMVCWAIDAARSAQGESK